MAVGRNSEVRQVMSELCEMDLFLKNWQKDPNNVKNTFNEYGQLLKTFENAQLEFNARPGISYSLRAKKHDKLFVLVDVVDDDPENRWLSICFYADNISDPEGMGDFVPQGLFGEDAMCFDFDEDDSDKSEYIKKRILESAQNS